jgi:hypothetical protein
MSGKEKREEYSVTHLYLGDRNGISPFYQTLYLKEHHFKNKESIPDNDEKSYVNKTLFITNTPIYFSHVDIAKLFSTCGEVNITKLVNQRNLSISPLATSSQITNNFTDQAQTYTNHVVFNSEKSLKRALGTKELPLKKSGRLSLFYQFSALFRQSSSHGAQQLELIAQDPFADSLQSGFKTMKISVLDTRHYEQRLINS